MCKTTSQSSPDNQVKPSAYPNAGAPLSLQSGTVWIELGATNRSWSQSDVCYPCLPCLFLLVITNHWSGNAVYGFTALHRTKLARAKL